MAGAAAFLVLGAWDLAGRLGRTWSVTAAGAGIALLLACGIVSFSRVEVWRDASTLWSDAVAKTPTSPTACFALGAAFAQEGRLKDPRDCLTLALAFDRAGFPDNALPVYELSLRLDPRLGPALRGLGLIRLKRGEYAEAVSLLERLRAVQPDDGEAQALLGEGYLLTGMLPEAEGALRRALALLPTAGTPSRLLGDLRFRQFRLDEARDAYRRAITLEPGDGRNHFQLSCLEAVSGRPEAALGEMEEALRRGYRDPVDLGRHPLRLSPAYQRLLARYRQ
jgi:tetratricopeptide (TPR) repeat protein